MASNAKRECPLCGWCGRRLDDHVALWHMTPYYRGDWRWYECCCGWAGPLSQEQSRLYVTVAEHLERVGDLAKHFLEFGLGLRS